jgi:hypothetical protein
MPTQSDTRTDPERYEFDLEDFTCLPASETHALVRLSGRWRALKRGLFRKSWTTALVPGGVNLLATDGQRTHTSPPLPDAAAVHGQSNGSTDSWRAAFALPIELVRTGRLDFALDLGEGELVYLPRPAGTQSEGDATFADEQAERERRQRQVEYELGVRAETARALRAEVDMIDAELRKVRAENKWMRTEVADSDRRVHEAQEALVAAQAEAEPERGGRARVGQELESRVAIEEARRNQLEQQLADASGEAERLRREMAELEHALEQARAEAGSPAAVLAEARRRIDALREGVAARRSAGAQRDVDRGLIGLFQSRRGSRRFAQPSSEYAGPDQPTEHFDFGEPR